MQPPLTFTEALALVIEYLRGEQADYESNVMGPWSCGDTEPPFHIWQAIDALQRTAPKLLNACKQAWELGYTLGDQDTPESRDLFTLHMLCDDALHNADED